MKYAAICFIWGAVAVTAWFDPVAGIVTAFIGFLTTMVIAD